MKLLIHEFQKSNYLRVGKALSILLILLMTFSVSAQSNQPKSTLTGATTGTESITGNASTQINAPAVNPERTETTASESLRTTGSSQTLTNNGRNNDRSSTGTTVTGNGSTSDSAPVDDGSAHPGNKGGGWIVTPRGR